MLFSKGAANRRAQARRHVRYLKRTWMLYAMLILPMAFFVVFRYVPMTYIVMAFQDFNMFRGIQGSSWADPLLKWFIRAFNSRDFGLAVRNTLMLNVLDLLICFPAPILLALLLNELPFRRYRRITQTVVYMPHFLSWIIISGIAMQLLAPRTGIVNVFLGSLGVTPLNFLSDNTLWVGTYVTLGLWKDVGWNTIIYLAAITGINGELYEAAEVDGAARLRKIWHITLPGIRPTIVVLLIMNLGRILGSEFDRPYAMQNRLVMQVGDVLSTYVYRQGIRGMQFSLAAAVGIFQSVVCVIFLLSANAAAKRFGERGIW
ncbi:MAG: ABC transporter permease subunit [Clostridia bacterium]|nr:ABC transporter permease subunit [Clostridia bacterium]